MTKIADTRISFKRVRELLHYDHTTGIFTNKVDRYRVKAGQQTGIPSPQGYIQICVGGSTYTAQELAYFWMKGEWAPMVDHKNLVRTDNRWTNLRPATRSQNMANASATVKSSSGIRGVYKDKKSGKWIAAVNHGSFRKTLGRFDDLAVAAKVRLKAMMDIHGEYSDPLCNYGLA